MPILVGGALIVGYFLLTNPDILSGILPPTDGGEFVPGTDDSSTPDSSSGGSPCGDLCRAKDCSGYKKQCTTGCRYCPNSGPNSPGGGGGSGSGTSSNGKVFGVNPNDCGSLCRSKKCSEYKRKCSTGCVNCCGSGPNSPKCGGGGTGTDIQTGSTSCPGGASGNCGGDCKQTCWHGQVTSGNVKDVCVGQKYSTSACSAARAKFCKLYGPCTSAGKAYAYRGTAYQLAYRAAQNNWAKQGISVS